MHSFWTALHDRLFHIYTTLVKMVPQFALAIVVLVITVFIAHKIRVLVRKRVSKKAKDPLLANFIGQVIRIAVIIFGIVVILGIIGLGDAASKILAGAGITAFLIGFAFKDIGENFLAGILMAFKRPFHIGDTVETNGIKGQVTGMSMRETIVKTGDGKDVFIPNSMIINTPLHNYTTDAFNRLEFTLTLPRTTELPPVIDAIRKVVENEEGVLKDARKPTVEVADITGGDVKILVRFWIDEENKKNTAEELKSEVMRNTLQMLREKKIIQ